MGPISARRRAVLLVLLPVTTYLFLNALYLDIIDPGKYGWTWKSPQRYTLAKFMLFPDYSGTTEILLGVAVFSLVLIGFWVAGPTFREKFVEGYEKYNK